MAMATCPAPAQSVLVTEGRSVDAVLGGSVMLPVPVEFVWPRFDTFHLYESGGSLREASADLGYLAVSVADRPTTREVSPRCMHVEGRVQDFVDVYPFPMPLVTTHVTCGNANRANSVNWRARVADGRMLAECDQGACVRAQVRNSVVSSRYGEMC